MVEHATSHSITRRRFLTVCAMAGALSAMPVTTAFTQVPLHHWNGILLGAQVSLTLAHPSKADADKIFDLCVREIKRLENIFTLYDSHSALSQLNANGVLQNPAPEMIDILRQARTYNTMTNGAFDVTVKPLEDGGALDLVGMDKLHIERSAIRFEKPGMAVTLNGIAQGYITDRITELLKSEGLSNVLVELGEKRAIGGHPSGRPWLLSLNNHDAVPLRDKALATSAAHSPNTGQNHIYVPASGEYADKQNAISVLADNAAMADALSTGFMSLEQRKIQTIEKRYSGLFKSYVN